MINFSSGKIMLLVFVALMVFLIFFSIGAIYQNRKFKHQDNDKQEQKGIVNKLNHSSLIKGCTSSLTGNSKLVTIFNKAKNPWRMTVATFQFIRYFGLLIFFIIALFLATVGVEYAVFSLGAGFLCFWYPLYYYKAIGEEREAEWNKMYEFIWVIKHNMGLYAPAKAFMNVKMYIQTHAPHNKEIIQGFDDFYRYWNDDEIDPYIDKFYAFSVPREIYQIIFNMHKTGEFPEDTLNALRAFIINTQDLTVEKTLSGVSGKATIYSLPFLMISVIISLMVPMIMQLIQFF